MPPKEWRSRDLKNGVIAGWGLSEKSNSELEMTPRKANIRDPISNEDCFIESAALAKISSNRTFCAGGENLGPCKGDSGKM